VKNLAILIDRPGHGQKFKYLCEQLNLLTPTINVVVFHCEPGPIPNNANFPMMDLVHGYDFQGTIVSTDIYTTLVMNNMLRPVDRYYYVWDFEYIYNPYSIDILKQVFKNKLIARNKDRFEYLESTWHKPELIIENFNHEELEKLVQ
jgi:hypothetical protein